MAKPLSFLCGQTHVHKTLIFGKIVVELFLPLKHMVDLFLILTYHPTLFLFSPPGEDNVVYILSEVLDTKNVEVSPTGEVKERMSANPAVKPQECAS